MKSFRHVGMDVKPNDLHLRPCHKTSRQERKTALEISSQHSEEPEMTPTRNFGELFKEELSRLLEELCQESGVISRASLRQDVWSVLKGLRESPEMASEDVASFLQHCFAADPVIARDFALLHNKPAASLNLNKATNTITFSLRSQPPRTRSSIAAQKNNRPVQSPLRQVVEDDDSSESSDSPKTKKAQRGKSTNTPLLNIDFPFR